MPLWKKYFISNTPCGVCMYLFVTTRLTVDSCMPISFATSRNTSGRRCSIPWSRKSRSKRPVRRLGDRVDAKTRIPCRSQGVPCHPCHRRVPARAIRKNMANGYCHPGTPHIRATRPDRGAYRFGARSVHTVADQARGSVVAYQVLGVRRVWKHGASIVCRAHTNLPGRKTPKPRATED